MNNIEKYKYITILDLIKISMIDDKKILQLKKINNIDALYINNEFKMLLTKSQVNTLNNFINVSLEEYFK